MYRTVLACVLLLAIHPAQAPAQGPPPGRGPESKLKISPDTVYFTKTGNETTLVRTVSVHRTGPGSGSLALTTSVNNISGGGWLSVGALVDGKLTLTATPGSLGPGIYQTKVTVTPTGQGLTAGFIQAFLRIATGPGGAPAAFVRPAQLSFRMTQGGANPEPKMLNVSSPTGGAAFTWTASRSIATPPSGTWLSLSKTSGTGAGMITAAVNGTGLAAGQYSATITVTSGASSSQIPVALEVRSASAGALGAGGTGKLRITPQAFNFIVHPGGPAPAPKMLEVRTTGASALSFSSTATSAGNWLSIPAGVAAGSTPKTIPLSVNPGSLAPGHYQGSVRVTSGAMTETAKVWLRIVGAGGSAGGAALGGSSSAVEINPRVIEFSSTGAAATPATAPIQIAKKSAGLAPLNFSATRATARGGAWLNITPASGALPATVNASVNTTGLAAGVYTAIITINITGGATEQRLVLVTLRISTPGEAARLAVRGGALVFRATRGGANPPAQPVQVETRGAASIAFQATTSTSLGGSWLSAAPPTGTAPSGVNISANITGLAAAVYSGAVVFQATGSPGALPATLDVVLIVTAPPALSAGLVAAEGPLFGAFLEPSPEFFATANSPVAVQAVVFQADGAPVDDATVRVTPSGDEPPFGLEPVGGGVYQGVFRSLAGGPVALTATASREGGVPAEFGIGGDLEGAEDAPPVIFQEGIVGAANFAPGATPVAPGAILSLFGRNLATVTAVAASLPLPRELGGVKVLVGGVEAPLFAVVAGAGEDYDQINFQAPVELASLSYADVVVLRDGVFSDAEGIAIVPSVPAVFTRDQQGTGLAAALHADFRELTTAQPARPGQTILLFAAGFGAVSPAAATGEPAGNNSRLTRGVEVRIGGRAAVVEFAGLAPGLVGLYQFNVTMPDGLTPGEAALEMVIDGISSGEGVTVPVGN